MHEHGACQPTPSNHHSHARSVHLAATQPNEPQPHAAGRRRACGNAEQGRASTAGREKATQRGGILESNGEEGTPECYLHLAACAGASHHARENRPQPLHYD